MSPHENDGQAAKKARVLTPAEAERSAVRELVKAARARGEELTGPHGQLKTITKTVLLESALEATLLAEQSQRVEPVTPFVGQSRCGTLRVRGHNRHFR